MSDSVAVDDTVCVCITIVHTVRFINSFSKRDLFVDSLVECECFPHTLNEHFGFGVTFLFSDPHDVDYAIDFGNNITFSLTICYSLTPFALQRRFMLLLRFRTRIMELMCGIGLEPLCGFFVPLRALSALPEGQPRGARGRAGGRLPRADA